MFCKSVCICSIALSKSGRTKAGSQRYQCQYCHRRYTPQPKEQGYPDTVRQQAIRLYVDGMNLRRIARHLGVVHQTVANWVAAHIVASITSKPFPTTQLIS
ncbi:helix-turn-helix domain-containing protein [Leptolyngbya sp. 7M]|nr:helix-turn-helix domain-containing protein [Leptolyngbya sp. 7M]